MKTALLTVGIFLCGNLSAQYLTFEGELRNGKDRTSLAFAHVYLKNSATGTVTNPEGKFRFSFPKNHSNDTLVFSSLGFESKEKAVSELDTAHHHIIALTPASIQLREVSVISISAESVWKKAIAEGRKRYRTFDHRMEGFYRTTFQEKGNFTRLLEAAVYLYGKKNPVKNPVIEYHQIRRSKDFREEVWQIYDGYLEHLVNFHPMGTQNTIVTPRGKSIFTFEHEGVVYQDDDAFYVIKATDVTDNPLFDAQLTIRKSDYAVFKVILFWHPESMQNFSWAWEQKQHAKFFADWQQSTYEYQEVGGKMFLQRASWHRKGRVISKPEEETLYATESLDELLITRIAKGGFEKEKELPYEGKNIYQLAEFFPYNEAFWQHYNRPVDSEYFIQAKQKMELRESLEEQFKQMGALAKEPEEESSWFSWWE